MSYVTFWLGSADLDVKMPILWKSFHDNECDSILLIIQYVFYTWMLIELDSHLPMNEYIKKILGLPFL